MTRVIRGSQDKPVRQDFVPQYSPTTAWGNVISMFMMLPGLRAFWPMSSVGTTGSAVDVSGGGRHLTNVGGAQYGNAAYPLAPYIILNGVDQYLSYSTESVFDIIGNETWMAGNVRGLTFGGWFLHNSLSGTYALITKGSGGAAGTAYWLRTSGANPGFLVGTASTFITVTSSQSIAAVAWNWIIARFDPSTETAIFVNNAKTVQTTNVPATLLNVSSSFNIGSYDGGSGQFFPGRTSLCFVSAAYLPDRYIQALYHHSRALFGV